MYLHRDYVDFRKAINGLVQIIESQMTVSPYDDAIFVFCSKTKDKLKVIHWDKTGFCDVVQTPREVEIHLRDFFNGICTCKYTSPNPNASLLRDQAHSNIRSRQRQSCSFS